MTQQEHLFIFTLYARQSAKFNILFEVLKTRGVVEADDLQAFLAHEVEEAHEHYEWVYDAWKSYQFVAAGLGVTTGLEDSPPPRKKA
jgi:hypothetical protein